MASFRANQSKIRDAFEKGLANNPIAALHETNMAMMRAAAETLIPGAVGKAKPAKPEVPANDAPAKDGQGDDAKQELAALREQMAAMQKKLDELGK